MDKPLKQPHHQTVNRPRTQAETPPEPFCQVVLHNDDVNTVEHVVRCLRNVFAYNVELAAKIMIEAHEKGRSIAEVETQTPAMEHRDQLCAYGLSASVERI